MKFSFQLEKWKWKIFMNIFRPQNHHAQKANPHQKRNDLMNTTALLMVSDFSQLIKEFGRGDSSFKG